MQASVWGSWAAGRGRRKGVTRETWLRSLLHEMSVRRAAGRGGASLQEATKSQKPLGTIYQRLA